MNRHVLAPVDTALELVADERSEVAVERDAFAAFAARVEACRAESPSPESPAAPPSMSVPSTGSDTDAGSEVEPGDRLRWAYRETVMDVDHYDVVYDEPLLIHVANEFGVDIATALGAGAPFTPAFKSALYDAATTARADREWFDEVLQRERASLADARAELDDVFTQLERHHDETRTSCDDTTNASDACSLVDLERRCERVGDERQAVVQTQLQTSRLDDELYDYLYGDQSWTYPVLSTVATLVDDLSYGLV